MNPAAGRGPKILFVEDDILLRKMAADTLRREGYCVIEASNGQEGLEIFRAEPGTIDLIVSDVVMPELSGPEMIRSICSQAHGKTIRVLFTSGYPAGQFIENVSLLLGFLEKPFNARSLVEKIQAMLEKPRKAT